MKKNFSTNYLCLWGVVAITIVMMPYVLLGENAYIIPDDFLDSTIGHLNNIIKNGQFFSFSSNIPLMEGIARSSVAFASPLELKALFFTILPTYWAIVVNIFLVKVIAFVGMFLLLNKYVAKEYSMLNFIASFAFCLVPFYEDYGISSAGIPIVCYALMNLKNKECTIVNLLLILLYGIYSSFALSGLFVCFFFFVFIIASWYEDKRINWYLLSAFTLLCAIYLATNWYIIEGFFFPSKTISHRYEWVNTSSIPSLLFEIIGYILYSQYHAGSFLAFPILFIFLLVYIAYRKKETKIRFLFYILLTLIFFIAIGSFSKMIPMKLFTSFQFDRFYFLYPALCFILFAKSIEFLYSDKKKWAVIFSVLTVLGCVAIPNRELLINLNKLAGIEKTHRISYQEFYDQQLFANIGKDLNLTQDYSIKVVSLGIYPSIAEYNGFWCLDGYLISYSLDYKHKFRKTIARELKKNESLRKYYDEWGSRCYLFSTELDKKGNRYLCSKEDNYNINLDIDTKALKGIGCQYIISAIDIKNYTKLGLSFINSYTTPNSYWNIRVYKIK